MCATRQHSVLGYQIPGLTVFSESGKATGIKPELLSDAAGNSAVRSLKVEMGPCGELVRVTAELLPSSILLLLKKPILEFVLDEQPVAAITLADGRVIRFD